MFFLQMKNFLLLLILIFFPAGLFSQHSYRTDGIVIIKDSIQLDPATRYKVGTDLVFVELSKIDEVTKYTIEIKQSTWDDLPDEIKTASGYTPAEGENPTVYIVTIEDKDGNKHDLVVDSLPTTVADKDGNVYVISEDGKVTQAVSDTDVKLDPQNKDKPHPEIATVIFEPSSKTRYAFDEYRDIYSKVTEYFQKYKIQFNISSIFSYFCH